MYKKKTSAVVRSIAALSRTLLPPLLLPPLQPSLLASSFSISRASSIGVLVQLSENPSPFVPPIRWLSTAAQLNDFPPEPSGSQQFAGDHRSHPVYQSNRPDTETVPSWNPKRSSVHGAYGEENPNLSLEERQRSNFGEVYGSNRNGGRGIDGVFYQAPGGKNYGGERSNGGLISDPHTNSVNGYQSVPGENPSFAACHSGVESGQPYTYANYRKGDEESYQNSISHNSENNQRFFQHNPNAAAGYQYQYPSMSSGYEQRGASSTNQQCVLNGESKGFSEVPVEFNGSISGVSLPSSVESGKESLGELQENFNFLQMESGFSGSSMGSIGDPAPSAVGNSETNGNIGHDGTIQQLDEFIKAGKVKDAVQMLDLLEEKGLLVDLPRFFQLIQACDDPIYLEEARRIHDHISHTFGNVSIGVHNKILKMYLDCGATTEAYQNLESMPARNLTTWDIMIMGLAKNGLGEDAIDVFTQFKKTGLQPDGGLFVTVFYACACLGAIDEGMLHFESMEKHFGITPGMEHYVGIVDMLGRSGYLDEALEFISQIPVEPSVDVWEALMVLSRLNGNMELGDRCAEIVEQLEQSRLCEEAKQGLLPVKASDLEKEKIRKKANPLESKSRVHEYKAGDRSHPHNDKIYAQLRCLHAQMKEAGYIPETRMVLHDVDQETKVEALMAHSERLAFSHGLMTSPARAEIRIIKNLRSCVDCHNAFKILSSIVGRLIIVRDAKRFHHFQNGRCSCNDYW